MSYRARHYAPGVGRFLQRDPNEYSDGPNLYSYALSRPTSVADPTGRTAEDTRVPNDPYGLNSASLAEFHGEIWNDKAFRDNWFRRTHEGRRFTESGCRLEFIDDRSDPCKGRCGPRTMDAPAPVSIPSHGEACKSSGAPRSPGSLEARTVARIENNLLDTARGIGNRLCNQHGTGCNCFGLKVRITHHCQESAGVMTITPKAVHVTRGTCKRGT